MQATIKEVQTNNGINYSDTKETISTWNVVAIDHKGEIQEPVTLRCYMGRSQLASRVYASLWAHNHPYSLAGHGWAGGYGYCKQSAAAAEAIAKAGIELSEPIDGRGTTAIEHALIAITEALGYTGNMHIVRN